MLSSLGHQVSPQAGKRHPCAKAGGQRPSAEIQSAPKQPPLALAVTGYSSFSGRKLHCFEH